MERHHAKSTKNVKSILIILSVLQVLFSPTPYANQPLPHKTIAITEIVAHPSLIAAKKGILDVLKEQGYEVGKNLTLLEANAQNNLGTATMIAKKWASLKPDVIVPISTPSAQTVVKATQNSSISIVFSSVTDPIAAGLVPQLSGNAHITGAIDSPPLDKSIALMKELVPTLKRLGVLYNPSEANSVKTLSLLKKTAGSSITIHAISVNSSNDLKGALHSLVGKVDAIYVPSDNTVFSCMPILVKLCRQHKIALFTSDPDSVKMGVLACVGYTQYDVGRTAGKQILSVLEGKTYLPITPPDKITLMINQTTASILGINVPNQLIGLTVIRSDQNSQVLK